MTDAKRQTLFLAGAAGLGVLTLLAGAWFFWLSGSVHLLFTGSVMLLAAAGTFHWWKRRAAVPTGPEVPGSADRQ